MKRWTSGGERFKPSRDFRCAFCNRKSKQTYSIVDGQKSCVKCDRADAVVRIFNKVICPLCKGKGHFVATQQTTEKEKEDWI